MNRSTMVDKKGDLRVLVGGTRWRLAVEKECHYCGKIFVTQKYYQGNEAKYCSKKCSGLAKRKRFLQKRRGRQCPVCGTFFKVAPGRSKRYTTCGNPTCTREMRRRNAIERHKVGGFAKKSTYSGDVHLEPDPKVQRLSP